MFNKKLIMALMALIISLMYAGYSHAWQFTMEAAFSNSYEYYGQLGKNGFFGEYDVDRSGAALNYAALNGWVGDQVGNLVSGSDASRQYFNLDFFPEIRLNPAIRIRAQYRLGDYNDPDASDYLANTRPGTDVATSDGQWTMWWLSAQTPWGILVMGKRPMWFGCGLQYGDGNPTTEGVAVVSNYGPMRIGFGFRPYWQQGEVSPYYNIYDKNGIRRFVAMTFLTYRSGPVDIGARVSHPKWHAGPESQLDLTAGGDQKTFRPMDVSIYHGSAYVKYNNGRFFFNSELAHWNHTITRQRASNRLGLALINAEILATRYFESWRFMTELGAFMGPVKLSLFYSYMPGHDRRNGVRIHKQPITDAAPQGTHEMHRPYSYLLGYAYGAGINAFDHNGNGYINAAAVYAGRVDYSLAANLNFFGSFLWADRTSHGYGWGFIKPNITPAADEYSLNYAPQNNAPAIPDMNLGWEVQAGADWDLLEGLNFHALFSYWQPGKWFNYACIDRGVNNWDAPNQNNSWGINPDRQIDPILGAEIAFSSEF